MKKPKCRIVLVNLWEMNIWQTNYFSFQFQDIANYFKIFNLDVFENSIECLFITHFCGKWVPQTSNLLQDLNTGTRNILRIILYPTMTTYLKYSLQWFTSAFIRSWHAYMYWMLCAILRESDDSSCNMSIRYSEVFVPTLLSKSVRVSVGHLFSTKARFRLVEKVWRVVARLVYSLELFSSCLKSVTLSLF